MPRLAIYNMEGEQVGEIELSDAVFAAPVNHALLHQAISYYLANRRVGTASTKTRGEVSGGGRKPWRQKGTGRARQGSIRAPHWRGGGIVFGPKPRDHRQELPRNARRAALRQALSARVGEGRLRVVEGLRFEAPRTKEMVRFLDRLGAGGEAALVVTADLDRNVYLSARNLPGVETRRALDLNAYDVLAHAPVVLSAEAARRLEEVLAP